MWQEWHKPLLWQEIKNFWGSLMGYITIRNVCLCVCLSIFSLGDGRSHTFKTCWVGVTWSKKCRFMFVWSSDVKFKLGFKWELWHQFSQHFGFTKDHLKCRRTVQLTHQGSSKPHDASAMHGFPSGHKKINCLFVHTHKLKKVGLVDQIFFSFWIYLFFRYKC